MILEGSKIACGARSGTGSVIVRRRKGSLGGLEWGIVINTNMALIFSLTSGDAVKLFKDTLGNPSVKDIAASFGVSAGMVRKILKAPSETEFSGIGVERILNSWYRKQNPGATFWRAEVWDAWIKAGGKASGTAKAIPKQKRKVVPKRKIIKISPEWTPQEKTDAIDFLDEHLSNTSNILTKKKAETIERFVDDVLKQKKYNRSVFRGFKNVSVQKLKGLLDNESYKFSQFSGGCKRYFESWSIDPKVSLFFATNTPSDVALIFQSRPTKNVVLNLTVAIKNRIMKISNDLWHDHFLNAHTNGLESYDEKEVLVKTGNRKYSLCRNVIYLRIATRTIKPSIKKLLMDRLEGGSESFELALSKDTHLDFACGGDKLMHLKTKAEVNKWLGKLSRS